MTSKERAYLKSLANKVPSLYQFGKDGLGENMTKQIDDALNARELIKVHVLENSGFAAKDAAAMLADATGSQVVQVIGSRIILYRRSEKNLCEM